MLSLREKASYGNGVQVLQSSLGGLTFGTAFGKAPPKANIPAINYVAQHMVLSTLTNSHLAVA